MLQNLALTKMLIFMLISKKTVFHSKTYFSISKIPEKAEFFLHLFNKKCCLFMKMYAYYYINKIINFFQINLFKLKNILEQFSIKVIFFQVTFEITVVK